MRGDMNLHQFRDPERGIQGSTQPGASHSAGEKVGNECVQLEYFLGRSYLQ